MENYKVIRAFYKSFSQPIWKIQIDERFETLGLETRDFQEGIPLFSLIDLRMNATIAQDHPHPEKDWTLAGVHKHWLILRKVGRDSPYGLGVRVWDAASKVLLWEAPHLRFLSLQNGLLECKGASIVSGISQFLEIESGQPRRKPVNEAEPATYLQIPSLYEGKLPDGLVKYDAIMPIHHLVLNHTEIFAFHEYTDPISQVVMHVRWMILKHKEVVLDEIIISPLEKQLPELFFAFKEQLFFIGNNKKEFVSYLV